MSLVGLLDGCDLVLAIIAEHVASIRKGSLDIDRGTKARFVWGEGDLAEHQQALGYQCNALMLILACFQL